MEFTERISYKVRKFRPSLTLALKGLAEERRRQGRPVYDFGLGETKGHLDPEVQAAGVRAFQEERTMYTDPAGLPELREAVLDWLGCREHYGSENVIIGAGAKQCLFNVFLAVCNPADCVLFDSAPWVSYVPIAVAAYAFPVQVLPLVRREDDLKITPDDLRRNLRMRPFARLFLLNNPVNPTAQLYTAAEVAALLRICAEHRVFFVLDRLYWKLLYDGRTYPEPPIDDLTRPWLIQVDGMSKNFRRAGGLRIGWCVAPEDVVAAMVNLQSHYTAGPATPTQATALAALTMPYRGTLRRELQEKRDLLHRETEGMPYVHIWPTPATFYSFWDVRATFGRRTPAGTEIRSADDLAAYLVEAAGVVTAPGTAFMQEGYLRLSFTAPPEDIRAGMAALRRALEALR